MLSNIFSEWKHRFRINSGYRFYIHEHIYCCLWLTLLMSELQPWVSQNLLLENSIGFIQLRVTCFAPQYWNFLLWCWKLSPVKDKDLDAGKKKKMYILCVFYSSHFRKSYRDISLRLPLNKTIFLCLFMHFIWIIWIVSAVADLYPLG